MGTGEWKCFHVSLSWNLTGHHKALQGKGARKKETVCVKNHHNAEEQSRGHTDARVVLKHQFLLRKLNEKKLTPQGSSVPWYFHTGQDKGCAVDTWAHLDRGPCVSSFQTAIHSTKEETETTCPKLTAPESSHFLSHLEQCRMELGRGNYTDQLIVWVLESG